ncbi:histidine phosphatase family protein [Rubellicoccus peritrichatus]|uniref:Histidine phosphatase family protein n=1 Tax=Rubellicoccus peritrichatus TaxID=3080537 RepID=A0AAQ3QX01_9BACT|nr:histidine phosphatase family protein [Puniceicoccus sp. CR14]WOO42390.1 histidine phosphatase family protein [Puniceicoccus sp. CR14]
MPRNAQRVAVCRHGATEWSKNGRHTSKTDLMLTPDGELEARKLRPALTWWDFSKVFCSPLQRARRTCELAGFSDQAEITDDLLEWDYGDYEGLTTPEIRKKDPGWTVFSHPVPGGEDADAVSARCDRVIQKIRETGGDCAVFAHGHILRVFTARWLGLPAMEGRHFILGTGTLNILSYEHESPAVKVWNAPLVGYEVD